MPGRPTNFDNNRARAYCSCSRCGWGCVDIFSLAYLFSFLSHSMVFGLNGPLRLYFSIHVYRTVSQREREREREKEERNDRREKKCPNHFPPAPTASAIGSCPIIIQISRTHRNWKFTQHHHFIRPPPPPIFKTTPYRLKYCLKGPLNPKQPTNQP